MQSSSTKAGTRRAAHPGTSCCCREPQRGCCPLGLPAALKFVPVREPSSDNGIECVAKTSEPAPWGSARERLVAAAQGLLVEEFLTERTRGQAVARAFAFLDPTVVAERAGVARSAFYHHWGDPPEGGADGLTPFQRFVGEVFESEWGDPYSPDVVSIAAVHRGPLADLIRKMVDVESKRYDSEAAWAAWRSSIALAAYGGSGEENIDTIYSIIAELYDGLLERFELQMRAPLTTIDLAAAVMALFDGLWLRRLYGSVDPNPEFEWNNPDTGDPEQWSLAAISAMGVLDAMTEPVDPNS